MTTKSRTLCQTWPLAAPAWVALLGLCGLFSSCHSTEWAKNDSQRGWEWRDRQSFVFGKDSLLARSESCAEQALAEVVELRDSLVEHLGSDLGRILWIVTDKRVDSLAEEMEEAKLLPLAEFPERPPTETTPTELML